MNALDIHSVYKAYINKVVSNTRDPTQNDTSNTYDVSENTRQIFDDCDLLKNHDLIKIHCIQSSLFKKRLNQLKIDQSIASISNFASVNEYDVSDPDFIMGTVLNLHHKFPSKELIVSSNESVSSP